MDTNVNINETAEVSCKPNTAHVMPEPIINEQSVTPTMGESAENLHEKAISVQYGCKHYSRKCFLRAPCCGKKFTCRHCHDEQSDHLIDRYKINQVTCMLCSAEQPVSQFCVNCGIKFAKYHCSVCKFYDDDPNKKIFHCEKCCLCRLGEKSEYFHCSRCDTCIRVELKATHSCVEKSMHANCPVCLEFMHTSVLPVTVLRCGHTLHLHCLQDMFASHIYTCPYCAKSVVDMTQFYQFLDDEIQRTPMPMEYKHIKTNILCNDCLKKTEVPYHVLGMKCTCCGSYNTSRI